MKPNTEQRKLAAIMFTDMVGYSALSQRDDKLALELLEEHRQLLREIFPRFNGTEIKTIGDAFLIEFQSALEAAQCAIEIQRTLAKRNHDVTADRRIQLKIGIHIGDVVHRGGDVYGDGVNIASRIEALAGAGGICVSMDVERQIRNALEARFEKLAPTELKNISVAMDLFRIVLPWEQGAKAEPAETTVRGRSFPVSRFAWIGAIVLVAAVAIGWWLTHQRGATPASATNAPRITSLAVLPFKNYSVEPNQEFFADGMADLLTTELSGIGALTVKSHQSALKFKGSTKSTPEIGQELHADAIVEGSVLRDGSQVTVNVQLIEALTDRHLWAKKFERDVTNVFKMRNEVVEAIAREIQVTLSPEQSSRLSSARAVNPAALQEYLLGRQDWNRQTEKGWDGSLQHFNRAKEIDPSFALAWAGVADVYWSSADAHIAPTEARAKAKAAAQRALELDDSLAEAHSALGAANYVAEFKWAESEKEFQRAIQLKPNYAPAHWQYGWLLVLVGRLDEALREMQRAVELDPLSAVMTTDLNVPYTLKGDYDKGIAQCRQALELDPSFYLPHFVLGWIEIERGADYAKAIEEFRVAQTMETQPIIIAYLGFAYARNGQKDKAMEMLDELNHLVSGRFVTPFCQALVYLGLRENSKALDWLEKAYGERSIWVGWLKVEPIYDPLRSDPRFQALYKKMNFPPVSAAAEQRKLAAIMFTDMVGYSALSQRNEALALELLEEHRGVLRGLFPKHQGTEIKTTGDGFLVEFASALDAVRCAVEIQKALAERNRIQPAERQVRIRIGIHLGDMVCKEGDVYGDGVNIAARIEPLAEPGGICISNSVYDQIENKVAYGLVRLSKPELKNIQASVQVYRVMLDGVRPPAPARPSRRRQAIAFGALLVVLAASLFLFLKFGARPKSSAAATGGTDQKSIAVLPFVNMSADKGDEYLSDGMTEELLNVLTKVKGLRVPGRSSSFAFKGKNEEDIFRKVGEELHVNTVLEGSVRKAGDKLRITAQLIKVADGYHLWSETYDGDMKDILAMQSDVAQRVVQALQVQLGVDEARALAKKPTENPEAFRLYLLGRFHFAKFTRDGWTNAIHYFEQALQVDPAYALAYCGLADVYGWCGGQTLSGREAWAREKELALKALALDPNLAEAHLSLGTALFSALDLPGSENELNRAVELNPNLAFVYDQYGWTFMAAGRYDEAIANEKKALELDPLNPLLNGDLGFFLYWARRYDEAIVQLHKALELDANNVLARHSLGRSLLWKGDAVGALAEFQKATALDDLPWYEGSLGYAYAVSGDRAKAEQILRDLDELAKTQYVAPSAQLSVYLGLGEKEKALDWAEKCYEDRDPMLWWIKEQLYDSIRNEPRFQTLLKKLGPVQ